MSKRIFKFTLDDRKKFVPLECLYGRYWKTLIGYNVLFKPCSNSRANKRIIAPPQIYRSIGQWIYPEKHNSCGNRCDFQNAFSQSLMPLELFYFIYFFFFFFYLHNRIISTFSLKIKFHRHFRIIHLWAIFFCFSIMLG